MIIRAALFLVSTEFLWFEVRSVFAIFMISSVCSFGFVSTDEITQAADPLLLDEVQTVKSSSHGV